MARTELKVDSVAEAYLALLAERGIEYLFANAGTDFAPIVEAYAKAAHTGQPAPKPLLATHENLALSMAHGYAAASGRVPAVMVHVSVGTANALCGIFNAARANVPILFTAGRSPLTEEGLPGARDTYIHWAQEMFDQAGMLREIVKWDYELRNGVQLETIVDRALTIATSPCRRLAARAGRHRGRRRGPAARVGAKPGHRHRRCRARPRGGAGARPIRRAFRDPRRRAPSAPPQSAGRPSLPSRLQPGFPH